MTNEKGLFAQAGLRNVRGSTIERKIMSTKTTTKRISLVVAAALAIGGFTAVSANATITGITATAVATSTPTSTTSATPTAVGSPVVATLNTVTDAAAGAGNVAYTQTFKLIDPNGTDVTTSATFALAAATVTATLATATYSVTVPATTVAGTYKLGTISFTPAMAGVYLIESNHSASTGDVVAAVTNSPTAGSVFVAGSGAVVASSGIGTNTITAVSGGIAKVIFGTNAHIAQTVYNLVSSGVGTIQTVAVGTNTPTVAGIAGASDFTQGAKITSSNNTNFNDVTATAASNVAGTQTLTWTQIDATTGSPSVVATQTITWGASPVATSAVAKLAAGNSCVAGAASSVTLAKTAAVTLAAGTTTGASLCVTIKDGSGTAMNGVPLDVSITGPGLVSISSNTTTAVTGTTRVASLTAATQAGVSTAAIGISADGTSGPATVTVSTGTTVLATASISFFDAPATVSATQVLSVASTSGANLGVSSAAPTGADSANSPAVIVTVKDKNGIVIPNLTTADIKATSSDTSVMSSTISSTESDGTGAGNTTKSTYNIQVTSLANTSGKSATLTFKVLGSDGVTFVTSAPIKFTLGGSVATVGLSLDKKSYSLGSTAVATLTAKDSSGNAAKDGILATTLSDVLTSSLGVNKTLFGASVDFIGGVATATFNAPAITGAWTITGTTGTGPSTDKGKALTVSATVTGGNDAAIASLITKINALAALIAKIQKKLGVK